MSNQMTIARQLLVLAFCCFAGSLSAAPGRAGDAVYVTDGYANSRVVKFATAGRFQKSWGTCGKNPGEFNTPHAIVMDSRGRLLVGDRENNRIQLFDGEGQALAQWDGFAPYG